MNTPVEVCRRQNINNYLDKMLDENDNNSVTSSKVHSKVTKAKMMLKARKAKRSFIIAQIFDE